VEVVWNSFLDSFEIQRIAPSGSKALPAQYFTKGSPKTQTAGGVSAEPSDELSDSDEEQDEA